MAADAVQAVVPLLTLFSPQPATSAEGALVWCALLHQLCW